MTLARPVLALPISAPLIALLAGAGFLKAPDDFAGLTSTGLARELGVSEDEAAEVLRVARDDAPALDAPGGSTLAPPAAAPASQTASQLLHRSPASVQPPASTLSRAVDALLTPAHAQADGLRQGAILEISGPPGIGKSACALGLALDVRRRALERGDGDKCEVLLVDTEGGLPFDRLVAAAESMADSSAGSPHADDILGGVLSMRVLTLSQLVGFFRSLGRHLAANPSTKLVVVDSLSYHLRAPSAGPDKQVKARVLQTVKDEAQKCAFQFGCSFVFVVQMATKFYGEDGVPGGFGPDGGDRAVLTAQLGDAWLPKGAYRLQMAYAGGTASHPVVRRIATLLSGPSAAGGPGRSAFAPFSQAFGGSQNGGGGGGLSAGRRAEFAIQDGLLADVRRETDDD